MLVLWGHVQLHRLFESRKEVLLVRRQARYCFNCHGDDRIQRNVTTHTSCVILAFEHLENSWAKHEVNVFLLPRAVFVASIDRPKASVAPLLRFHSNAVFPSIMCSAMLHHRTLILEGSEEFGTSIYPTTQHRVPSFSLSRTHLSSRTPLAVLLPPLVLLTHLPTPSQSPRFPYCGRTCDVPW